MRLVSLAVLLSVLSTAGPALADDAHVSFGDLPRTFSHYLSAREAALCRADAATGGVSAYFLNPAAVSEVEGASGVATLRLNLKDRAYLPEGDERLEATDDGLLFSQAVAVKRSGGVVFGFGYSCPAYQNLKLSGRQEVGDPPALRAYDAEFVSGLRCFEVLLASGLGSRGQAAAGVAAGIANLNEKAVERVPGETLDTARLTGIAASVAVGFLFDATESFQIGLGYRWGSAVGVSGEWYRDDRDGESTTAPVAVAGLRFRPARGTTISVSYLREGWEEATSTLAAYKGEEGPGEEGTSGLARDLFDGPVSTAAVGVAQEVLNGRAAVRMGASKQLESDVGNAVVPEYSLGLGGAVRLRQYSMELAVVRERFSESGESGGVTNYGVYLTVGYDL